MRLKEIKTGMSIRCHNFEQGEAVVKQLKAQGAVFSGHYSPNYTDEHCVVFFNSNNQYSFYKFFEATCDFYDLIMPELTAEEVVPILTEICNRYNGNEDCEGCPMNGLERICNRNECPFTFKDYKQVIKICEQWKAKHEKKEPEIEWVYRVFGAENYGEKFFKTEEEAIKRCEELAKSQKTKQYARYERVCRVKAVE